jgi:iron complex transport system substrate-binding protein
MIPADGVGDPPAERAPRSRPPRRGGWPRGSWSRRAATALLLCLALPACDAGTAGRGEGEARPEEFEPTVLVDAAGVTHDVEQPPARIVSLVPSATAVLVALGAEDRLAGRTDYDTLPALADVPSVGGGIQPNLEAIVSLRPDLVIRFHGPSDASTPEQLDRLGIAHFAVRPDGIEDVKRIVRELGALTGRTRAADSLVARTEEELADVAARVAAFPPVRTAFLLGGTPPMAVGPGTFIHELIRIAGGVNVFADLRDLYAPVSPEQIVSRGADVYLTLHGTRLDPVLVGRTPVRELGHGVQLPGPDLGAAAYQVARALHPDAFR